MKWLGFGLALAFLVGPIAHQQAQQPTPEQLQAESPPVEVHFSPKGGCTEAVVAEINTAKTSILVHANSLTSAGGRQGLEEGRDGTIVLVEAYSFTSAPVAKALVEAHKRGVKVEVIVDKSNTMKRGSAEDSTAHAGGPSPADAKSPISSTAQHNVMIVDSQVVITGGFDFTRPADENNAGDLLVLRDTAIAEQYKANWKEHAPHAEKYAGIDARASDAITTVKPAAVRPTAVKPAAIEPATSESATAEPTTPSDDPAKKFLASIAGRWHLSYSARDTSFSQELTIDSNGNYFVTTRGTAPFFLIRDVFYDPTWRIATFSKVHAQGPRKGKTLQVEVLKLAPDGNSMKGHGQQDGHSIEYTRVTD